MRLRHRFPKAIIIFIYAWSSFQYLNSRNGKTPFDTRMELFPSIKGLREELYWVTCGIPLLLPLLLEMAVL